jgi:hypothetical protein
VVVRYHLTDLVFAEGSDQVFKEVGINCGEVPWERLPLNSGI